MFGCGLKRVTHSAPTWVRFFYSIARLDASVQEGSLDYSRLIYSKLAQDTNYEYLDTSLVTGDPVVPSAASLLHQLRNRENNPSNELKVDQQVFSNFKDWAKRTQLHVGFLMHLHGNVQSAQYFQDLIKQLLEANGGLDNFAAHDLVTLLLLIYFRRDFTVEDLSEFLDLDELQNQLAVKISSNVLTPEEICASCLGLKRINNFKISNTHLRNILFKSISIDIEEKRIQDFYLMTILTLLARQRANYHDSPVLIAKALDDFKDLCTKVSLMTAIKMMSFGIHQGIENNQLTETVCKMALENLDELNLKDLVNVTDFFSRSSNVNEKLMLTIKGEISRHFENVSSVSELVDVMNCLAYMSINEVYRLEVIYPILDSLAHTDPSEVSPKGRKRIAEAIVKNLAKTAFKSDRILSDLKTLDSRPRYVATICRLPAFLCFNLRLDKDDLSHGMSMDLAAAILALDHKKLPLQLQAPQMSLDGLDNRFRLLTICYRSLVSYLGNERFVGVARILPQFPEPDLVIGNIAGSALTVPDYLTDPTILRPKRAPVAGEWTVLVMANRKEMNPAKKLIGLEEVKVRQLKKIGFKPVIVPYSSVSSSQISFTKLSNLINEVNIKLPNLDDGKIEETRNF